jgi:transcriptional repressor NF-X1
LLCGNPCEKTLNCGLHKCSELCHIGTCEPCEIIIEQVCFCAQNTRQLPCSVENSPEEKFACGAICQRSLECGKHLCDRPCHEGSCESCPLQLEKVHTCPCGKTELAVFNRQKKKNLVERKQCTDPVPNRFNPPILLCSRRDDAGRLLESLRRCSDPPPFLWELVNGQCFSP